MYEIPLVLGLLNLPFIIASKGKNWWNVFAMGWCFGIAAIKFIGAG